MRGILHVMAVIYGIFFRRADYLDRGLTPHLLDISKEGLRAKSVVPIFPVRFFNAYPQHKLIKLSSDVDISVSQLALYITPLLIVATWQ